MSHHTALLLIAILIISSNGCSPDSSRLEQATHTPDFFTATLPPTPVPLPSATPLPPTLLPTLQPVEGLTTTQVNVRAEPNTSTASLGVIGPSVTVLISGKDSSGTWYQILFAEAPDGKGWVRAEYVRVAAGAQIPVIGASAGSGSGASGLVIQQINVRSGPGTEYESLGTLNPNDVVAITGVDPTGAWMQVEYSAGPEGRGWVAAAFLQTDGANALPIIGEAGQAVGTGTSTAIPIASTPTILPALPDGDSIDSPAVIVDLEPSGAKTILYQGDVSTPEGDAEDWLQFIPHVGRVRVTITCDGNGLRAEVWQDRKPIAGLALGCGEHRIVDTLPGESYFIRSQAIGSGPLQYTHYTLKLETIP